ncbi:MAG TPA: ATP-binding cassette domain-containing protein [Terriglobales bacterium]|nr:ATP-binding cassette domain-containing protein [Terriglobales bacterium]
MSHATLRVQGVGLYRGPRKVLDRAPFEVARGELVVLMGPSGVGKTTLLRLIAGLETFHSGTVHVEEVALNGGAAHPHAVLHRLRAKVGMVFQYPYLFEHLPVLKNVWLAPVHAHNVPRQEAEDRARELLGSLGVEHRAAALPRELSGASGGYRYHRSNAAI